MRLLIVEDERPAREYLEKLCRDEQDISGVWAVETGLRAIENIDSEKPDLIFLDINLPDISGIDVLKNINHHPEIIFCTAYDEYAVAAFEHRAVDFLLKPYSRERFQQAMEKVRERLVQKKNLESQLSRLLAEWQPDIRFISRIPAKVGEKIYLLNTDDVAWFSSENRLVFAHQVSKKYAINYTLDELEKRLEPERFFRIHRSTIVNLDYVVSIEPYFGGAFIMKLKTPDKTELKISRNAARDLRRKLGW